MLAAFASQIRDVLETEVAVVVLVDRIAERDEIVNGVVIGVRLQTRSYARELSHFCL